MLAHAGLRGIVSWGHSTDFTHMQQATVAGAHLSARQMPAETRW